MADELKNCAQSSVKQEVLDIGVYTRLKEALGDEQFDEFIQVTNDSLEEAWQYLLESLDCDIGEAVRIAHSIKGIALNIGAKHLVESAVIVEKQLREDVIDQEQLQLMKTNLEQVKKAIT